MCSSPLHHIYPIDEGLCLVPLGLHIITLGNWIWISDPTPHLQLIQYLMLQIPNRRRNAFIAPFGLHISQLGSHILISDTAPPVPSHTILHITNSAFLVPSHNEPWVPLFKVAKHTTNPIQKNAPSLFAGRPLLSSPPSPRSSHPLAAGPLFLLTNIAIRGLATVCSALRRGTGMLVLHGRARPLPPTGSVFRLVPDAVVGVGIGDVVCLAGTLPRLPSGDPSGSRT